MSISSSVGAVVLMIGLLLFTAPPGPVVAQDDDQEPQLVAVPTAEPAAKAAADKRARTRLRIDDGTAEQVVGLTRAGAKSLQIVVLNRFTPTENRLPLELDTVLVKFPRTCQIGDTGLRADMTFEALVYTDPSGSGEPENAILVARQPFQLSPSDRTFTKIELDAPVTVTSGDVWVGYTNTFTATDDRLILHAALDTTTSRGRSWIFYNGSGANFSGDVLTGASVRRTIDEEGIAGNWLIRARGRIGTAAAELR